MYNKYSIIIVVLMLLFFVMTGCDPKITDSQTESIENIVTNSLTVENASETDTNNDIANKSDNDDKQISDNFLERDIKVFENYFSKILSIDNVTISSDNIDLYGTSNGYRIYSVAMMVNYMRLPFALILLADIHFIKIYNICLML